MNKTLTPFHLLKFCLVIALFTAFLPLQAQETNPQYDAALAKKLGADDYGMKNYILVILKTGANKNTDSVFLKTCFATHFKTIKNLVKEGKLLLAGPIKKNDEAFRGIFILNVDNVEAAKELLQTDLTIQNQIFTPLFFNWYGSAALATYLPDADKISKLQP